MKKSMQDRVERIDSVLLDTFHGIPDRELQTEPYKCERNMQSVKDIIDTSPKTEYYIEISRTGRRSGNGTGIHD